MPDVPQRSLYLPDPDAPPPVQRRNHLLAIGIDAYADARIANLRHAVKDIQNLGQLLQDQYDFQPAQVRLLTNAAASRRGIIRAIDQLIREVQPDDNALLMFSGQRAVSKPRAGYCGLAGSPAPYTSGCVRSVCLPPTAPRSLSWRRSLSSP
ncbi:MAG: hypothetical protein OHK0039_32790 [Bacteroidia bacterium]